MLALVLSTLLAAQVQESITVARVLADVRVTNMDGELITDLTPEEFEVRIGRTPAIVESAEWITDASEMWTEEETPASPENPAAPRRAPGRLIVLFVQTDFARNNLRTEGQMKFGRFAERMVESFAPEDRLAVFSFDSHLKFRLDFTSDKGEVVRALRGTLRIDEPPPPPVVHNPSLASRLDREAMRRVSHSETALLHIANALRPIPGPKSLLLLGWGLGERTPAGVRMKRQWTAARYALDAARVSIFALDTTNADYHDLQLGLQAAAEDTGGFYAQTHLFPEIAVERLQRALRGHYELELRTSEPLKSGTYPLIVRAKRRGVSVLAPSSVFIRP